MRKMKIIRLLSLLLVCAVALLGCQAEQSPEQPPATTLQFDVDQAWAYLCELTKDRYAGRLAGTEGNQLAAEYLSGVLQQLGFEPYGEDDYYQWYNQSTVSRGKAELAVLNSAGRTEQVLAYRHDFLPVNRTSGLSVSLTQSWITVGAETSLVGVELDGKVVLWDKMHDAVHSESAFSQAALVLYSCEKTGGYGNRPAPLFLTSTRFRETATNMVAIAPETFIYLSGLTGKDYQIRAELEVKQETVRVPNVIGRLPAAHETDETLIIGAHFDHLGTDPNGAINPGASDNAAGVAMMLELAHLLVEQQDRLNTNVIIAAFNGEEHGMLGSSHFVERLQVNKANCRVLVLDVVGCRDARLVSPGSHISSVFWNELRSIADGTGISITPVQDNGRSDHAPFIRSGFEEVVWLMHFSQDYFDQYYHTPADTVDIIDGELFTSLGQLLTNYLEVNCLGKP